MLIPDDIKTILSPFIKYFEKTYIGSIDNTQQESIYPNTFWCVYDRVLKNISKTTNCAERWHLTLNNKCNVNTVNIAKLLSEICNEETRHKYIISQFTAGKVSYLKKNDEIVLINCLEGFYFF
jgi:hypothetical protein